MIKPGFSVKVMKNRLMLSTSRKPMLSEIFSFHSFKYSKFYGENRLCLDTKLSVTPFFTTFIDKSSDFLLFQLIQMLSIFLFLCPNAK